jgi:hypothetical protein
MKSFTTFDSNSKKLEKNHSIASIINTTFDKPLTEYIEEDIFFFYSFGLLNFYTNKIQTKDLNHENIIAFIKKHTLQDIKKLGYSIVEEFFTKNIEGPMKSRLIIDERPDMILDLVNSTQQATEVIQRVKHT